MQFSVIIPQYNSRSYIEETLKSLQQQTFRDFEVIVIDDGSSDGSFELADKALMELNLKGKVVKRPDSYPKGVSGSRNYGIDSAKGDWICFLDSDDLFHSEKLEAVKQNIEQNPKVLAFHHAVEEFDDVSGEIINTVVLSIKEKVHQKLPELLDLNNVCTSTVTLQAKLIKRIGSFDTRLNGIEDYFAWLKISKLTSWYYDPRILTKYRVRQGSLMGFRALPHYINQNQKLYNAFKSAQIFTSAECERLKHHLFYAVMVYYTINSINKFGLAKTNLWLLNWSFSSNAFYALKAIYRINKQWFFRQLKKGR